MKPKGVGSRVGVGGWGGGPWWGENEDNCTWTTIKKKLEKNSALPLVSPVILDNSANFIDCQYPHPSSRYNNSFCIIDLLWVNI